MPPDELGDPPVGRSVQAAPKLRSRVLQKAWEFVVMILVIAAAVGINGSRCP